MRAVLLFLVAACNAPQTIRSFGSSHDAFAAVDRVCRIGDKVERRREVLWDVARSCVLGGSYTEHPYRCEVQLTKNPGRSSVRSIDIACAISATVSARLAVDLAGALNVGPSSPLVSAFNDVDSTRPLDVKWSNGQTFVYFARSWSEGVPIGHLTVGVWIDEGGSPRSERTIGDEWEHLWKRGASEGETSGRIDPVEL